MIDLGPHAAFVWSAYAAVALVLVGLIAWLVLDGYRLRQQLTDLEARGVKRRSDVSPKRSGHPRGGSAA